MLIQQISRVKRHINNYVRCHQRKGPVDMIVGEVNANREAVVHLQLHGPTGQAAAVDVVIDTGFTDMLTLPPSLIASLALKFRELAQFTLGDGSSVVFSIYTALVDWHGQEREVFVLETDNEPLIGMSLLYGSRLTIDVLDGGKVRLEPLL